MSDSVAVVMVAFGAQPSLLDAVNAIRRSKNVIVEIVVVDNGDCSEISQLTESSDIKIIKPTSNLGFAGGCNLGVRHCTSNYILLLNPDCIVNSNTVSELVNSIKGEDLQIATPNLLFQDRPDFVNAQGLQVHPLGYSWCRNYSEKYVPLLQDYEVPAASGACLLISRTGWNILGGMSDIYFAYCEDVDFSLRCKLLGGKVVLSSQAIAFHDYHFSKHSVKMYLLSRNRRLLYLSWPSTRTLLLFSCLIIQTEFLTALLSLREGWFRSYLKGVKWTIVNIRRIWRYRKGVQQIRITKDRNLLVDMTVGISPANYEITRIGSFTLKLIELQLRLFRRLV